MTQVYNILILSIFFLSCTPNRRNNVTEEFPLKMDSVEKKRIYKKIESFVNEYNAIEEERLRLESPNEKNYAIDDSLCLYMAKLDKRELIEDDYFRSLMGVLLEKEYLAIRNSGEFPPETFPVYNTSILYNGKKSNEFALNIALQDRIAIDKEFNRYAAMRTEFLCIDSVVRVLDKLPQMQKDSNHQKCMYLVKNNKTGGCKW